MHCITRAKLTKKDDITKKEVANYFATSYFYVKINLNS